MSTLADLDTAIATLNTDVQALIAATKPVDTSAQIAAVQAIDTAVKAATPA